MKTQKPEGNVTFLDRLAVATPRDPNTPTVTATELKANPGAYREALLRGELRIVSG